MSFFKNFIFRVIHSRVGGARHLTIMYCTVLQRSGDARWESSSTLLCNAESPHKREGRGEIELSCISFITFWKTVCYMHTIDRTITFNTK